MANAKPYVLNAGPSKPGLNSPKASYQQPSARADKPAWYPLINQAQAPLTGTNLGQIKRDKVAAPYKLG